jgi:hypothetical protein
MQKEVEIKSLYKGLPLFEYHARNKWKHPDMLKPKINL